jgi:hypothetical protein
LDFYVNLIQSIQENIYSRLEAQNKVFTSRELKDAFSAICQQEHPDVNEKGQNALLDFIGWMCWHEGLVAPP